MWCHGWRLDLTDPQLNCRLLPQDSGDLAVAAFCTVVFIAFAVICVNGSKRIIGRFTDDNSPAAGGGSGGVSATGSGAGQVC